MTEYQTMQNHEAMDEISPRIEAFRDSHDLSSEVELFAASRLEEAESMFDKISNAVAEDELDETVANYVDFTEHAQPDSPQELSKAIAVGLHEVYVHPDESPITTAELQDAPTEQLGEALRDISLIKGDQTVDEIIESIEHSGTIENGAKEKLRPSADVPEFDRLDDYTPEFSGQLLLHRANGELNPGDIVLPSNQISAEMHQQLNARRSFTSSSSPQGSGGYDTQLAHAGTRDFGATYGEYLYVVEPLEGDTLKWGENFGASVDRGKKAESRAIDPGNGNLATTDTYTGKLHNEVVSINGFRVVERIAHEPAYDEAMLPWPVSPDAIQRHKDRRENSIYTVVHDDGHPVSGFIRTTSRPKPGKIGAVNSPGTYRAGADEQIAANLQNKFDLRKQQAEYPGQMALPEMPLAKFRVKHEVSSGEVRPYPRVPTDHEDTPLPGLEDTSPRRPML